MLQSTVTINQRDQQKEIEKENHVAMTRRIKWLLFVLLVFFFLDLIALLIIKFS